MHSNSTTGWPTCQRPKGVGNSVPDADRLRDYATETAIAGTCILCPGVVSVLDVVGLLYFDRPRRFLAAAARCTPARLHEAPFTTLVESLAGTGDLDILGGIVGVADILARALPSWEVADALVRLVELHRAREAREVLLETEWQWTELEPERLWRLL